MKKPTPFGKYYLLERINVGGMAEVYRAKAFGVEGFERLVAVKRILPNIAEDKEFIRMFIEEAKLAVQLNHANIAQIFDLGVVDGSYYIALEHVHGRDMRAIFDRCRGTGEPMAVAQACFVVMKVCEGLDYAHNKRDASGRELHLVHRDVSPQNVLVSFEGEVKLIDFGIAKAAGKGSKTQAGILKGKFGYMSPEQVRGIPIDRRSDVFSCGIVLYELLTGERLFVGESDFSTLEKVRNVEILPPSTYNRRIPDELERIVLKALAKDADERYANAIDLHDELQAFVYTAGEFYSRKDLAGWMKKTFGKEIEEESAKLEGYRALKPPTEPPPVARTPNAGARTLSQPPAVPRPAGVKATLTMSAVGSKPPPPPRTTPPPMRVSAQVPAVQPPPPRVAAKGQQKDELAWEDDELETQIFDDVKEGKSKPSTGKLPLEPGATTPAPDLAARGRTSDVGFGSVAGPNDPTTSTTPAPPAGPDLSSLVSGSRGWENALARTTSPGMIASNGANGASDLPARIATGSQKAQMPPSPALAATLPLPMPDSFDAVYSSGAPSAPLIGAPVAVPSDGFGYDPGSSQFGKSIVGQRKGGRGIAVVAAGGAILAVAIVVGVVAFTGKKKPASSDSVQTKPGALEYSAEVLAATGFDLYVTPPGVTTWRLDGDARTERLPSRIRGITPGQHTVAIDAPAGFMTENRPVSVEAGKAAEVRIDLTAAPVKGVFESTPPGAKVSLIVDGKRQELGLSPQELKLDAHHTYQVLFEKDGYVSVNRPIVFTGKLEERFVVPLEKAQAAATAKQPEVQQTAPPTHPTVTPPPQHPTVSQRPEQPKQEPKQEPKHEPKVEPKQEPKHEAPATGTGTLAIGSKPPCEIVVDGSSTGLTTPKKIPLSAGKHKITLVNADNGIKETFTVDIKADQETKAIKNYMDRVKAPAE